MRHVIALICLGLILCASIASAELQTATFTSTTPLTIPDSPGGPGTAVTQTMTVDLDYYIQDIRVYIDVAIVQWSSDLRIWVISAWDTELELFHIAEGGEPATNPMGWYPTDFTPYHDMTQWHGEGGGGVWTIVCQDWSEGGGDSVLNEWRVEIGYEDTVPAEGRTLTSVKSLFE